MDILNKAFHEGLATALAKGNLAESDIEDVASKLTQKLIPRLSAGIGRQLRKRAPSMLREHRKLGDTFSRRNYKR